MGMALLKVTIIVFLGLSFSNARVIDTIYGAVNGTEVALHNGAEVISFNGIPFAKPPVGELRLAAPVEPDPWEEILDAQTLPNACPQFAVGLVWLTHPFWTRYDEDCLYLNINTPNTDLTDLKPVMVFMHGGGYYAGSGFQYLGAFLAAKDVVVVTINYRLGALGFMTTEDEAAPGNYALLDQIRALEFVRDNIAAFGGDPGMVTIFGESAGGTSVGLLGLIPRAQGLFHQIITQSGTEMAGFAVTDPRAMPSNFTRQVAEKLDCPTEDSFLMVACLREQSAQDLRTTSYSCPTPYGCSYGPLVDGDVIPALPREMRENDLYPSVPIMSGVNTEDGALSALAWSPNIGGGFNRSEFLDVLWNHVNRRYNNLYPDRVEDLFEGYSYAFTPWPHIEDKEANRQTCLQIDTDSSFGYTADVQMTYHEKIAPVYQYMFSFFSANGTVLFPEWMGVFHAVELPYVFGMPLLQWNPEVQENSGITWDILPWTEEDIEWSEFVMTLWTNFAKTGNPTPSPVQAPGDNGAVTWDLRTPDAHNYLLIHRNHTEVRQDYRAQEYAFWTDHLPYLLGNRPPSIPDEEQHAANSNSVGKLANDFLTGLLKERITADFEDLN